MKRRTRPRVGINGGFTIPKAMRESLGLVAGDEVELRVVGGELRISAIQSRWNRIMGLLALLLRSRKKA